MLCGDVASPGEERGEENVDHARRKDEASRTLPFYDMGGISKALPGSKAEYDHGRNDERRGGDTG